MEEFGGANLGAEQSAEEKNTQNPVLLCSNMIMQKSKYKIRAVVVVAAYFGPNKVSLLSMLLSFEVSFFYFYQFPLDNKDGSLELSFKKVQGEQEGGLENLQEQILYVLNLVNKYQILILFFCVVNLSSMVFFIIQKKGNHNGNRSQLGIIELRSTKSEEDIT